MTSNVDDHEFYLPPAFQIQSPYMLDYFGLWMIHGPSFESLANRVNGMNLHAHLQSESVRQGVVSRDSRSFQTTEDGIAVFRVNGPMMKSVPSMADGTSTVRLRQQIREAKRDSQVIGAMLVSDTPGGTVKGNADLVADVAAFAATKPLYVFVEDLTASAGVSVASQATKRYANNATAQYGAMGTYAVAIDSSAMAEKLGVKVHVIRAGEFKGAGTQGTQITDEQLAEMQRTVDASNAAYLASIAKGLGRSIDAVQKLADGRIHLASDAVQMGLLDGIQTYEQTYAQLVAEAKRRNPPKRSFPTMSANPSQSNAATLAELKQAFPKSTADWRETQLEKGASISDAALSYASFVETQATAREAELNKKLEDATKKNEASSAKQSNSLGYRPLTVQTQGEYTQTGDPVQDFDAAVRARLPKNRQATMDERQAAISYVARTNPSLHQAALTSTNPGVKQKRLLQEKFEGVVKS